jgi:hypothetical protein
MPRPEIFPLDLLLHFTTLEKMARISFRSESNHGRYRPLESKCSLLIPTTVIKYRGLYVPCNILYDFGIFVIARDILWLNDKISRGFEMAAIGQHTSYVPKLINNIMNVRLVVA